MALFSRIRTQALSWWQDIPFPIDQPDATPIFQAWHEFESSDKQWNRVQDTRAIRSYSAHDTPKITDHDPKFVLVTWNVDSFSALPELRISAIISHIVSLAPAVDIIFFQEVSRAALAFLLGDSRIRESWYSSEADTTSWEGQSFSSITLLSKSRFSNAKESLKSAALGPVWRVKYPSRFGRDALCCDIFVPLSSQDSPPSDTRIRLVNVHLDSLPIQPSRRPRQISIITSILRSASRGLVAGDFNPVLPEDETLIKDNSLVDAWLEMHHEEPGFTWGVDGKQPFPPNRLDKVAMVGLKVLGIEVMHPDFIMKSGSGEKLQALGEPSSQNQEQDSNELVPWSDHSGLLCSFGLVGY